MDKHCRYCGAADAPNCYYDSESYFDGVRTRGCYMRENKLLRTELLRCYNVLPGIEKLEKLPDLILSGTVSDTVHAFTLMQSNEIKRFEDRSNRLEQMGDLMRWWCADSESVDHWDQAKESNP